MIELEIRRMSEELKNRGYQIASSIEACDWSGCSIGNKEILRAAVEELRHGADAAVKSALEKSVQNFEFTDLILAVNQAADPSKAATAIIGTMSSMMEMRKGKDATKAFFRSIAAAI